MCPLGRHRGNAVNTDFPGSSASKGKFFSTPFHFFFSKFGTMLRISNVTITGKYRVRLSRATTNGLMRK